MTGRMSTAWTTDGWRAQSGPAWSEREFRSLTDGLAVIGALGTATAIGFDGRAGADRIAKILGSTLERRGMSVYLSDSVLPTPALGLFVARHDGAESGIMVTASHNPPGYLGLKLRDAHGLGALQVSVSAEELMVRGREFSNLAWGGTAMPQSADLCGPYRDEVLAVLHDAAENFTDTVILDTAHGAVGALRASLPSIVWHRAEVLPFFGGATPDPALRPQADAVAEQALSAVATPLRAVVAMTDGDGDRLVLATRRSGYIDSSEQASILINSDSAPEGLFTTCVAPLKLAETARRRGIVTTVTDVGYKHVVDAWLRAGSPAAMGVEPNGALVVCEESGYFERDALAGLARMLRCFPSVDMLDEAVREVRARFPHSQVGLNSTRPVLDLINELERLLGQQSGQPFPGIHLWQGADWRVALRRSGTEELVRIYAEVNTHMLQELRDLSIP